MRRIIGVLAFMSIAACGGSGEGSGGGSSTSDVEQACSAHTNIPKQICVCVGKKSSSLNSAQKEFVIATVSKDESRSAIAGKNLMPSETATAATFFMNAAADCAR